MRGTVRGWLALAVIACALAPVVTAGGEARHALGAAGVIDGVEVVALAPGVFVALWLREGVLYTRVIDAAGDAVAGEAVALDGLRWRGFDAAGVGERLLVGGVLEDGRAVLLSAAAGEAPTLGVLDDAAPAVQRVELTQGEGQGAPWGAATALLHRAGRLDLARLDATGRVIGRVESGALPAGASSAVACGGLLHVGVEAEGGVEALALPAPRRGAGEWTATPATDHGLVCRGGALWSWRRRGRRVEVAPLDAQGRLAREPEDVARTRASALVVEASGAGALELLYVDAANDRLTRALYKPGLTDDAGSGEVLEREASRRLPRGRGLRCARGGHGATVCVALTGRGSRRAPTAVVVEGAPAGGGSGAVSAEALLDPAALGLDALPGASALMGCDDVRWRQVVAGVADHCAGLEGGARGLCEQLLAELDACRDGPPPVASALEGAAVTRVIAGPDGGAYSLHLARDVNGWWVRAIEARPPLGRDHPWLQAARRAVRDRCRPFRGGEQRRRCDALLERLTSGAVSCADERPGLPQVDLRGDVARLELVQCGRDAPRRARLELVLVRGPRGWVARPLTWRAE